MRDAGHRTPDIGQRTSDGGKSKNNISTPQGGGHNKAKTQNQLFYDPSLSHRGGRGVKLTSYLDYPHMLSQYLLIHSKAIKATIKKI